MALPYPPLNPGDPIPNNPFYYPQTNRLEGGDQGILIIGAGLAVTPEGILSATGTGGTAVTTLTAGAGLTVSQPDGNVLITNTGVLSLTSGGGLSITGSGGNLTITNTAPAPSVAGTVTQVDTGTGLTGGPITGTGTIELETVSTVAPGTYTNATVTVDAYGRVTAASPGGGLGSLIQANAPLSVNASYPQTISINNASTASPGVVRLNTSTNSTSTTEAATPSAVKASYDNANTALTNAANALSTATSASTAASNAQSTANSAQFTATSAAGAAATAQSTANAAAINAAAAQAVANAAIPCASFTAKGQILAANGASTFTALPAGTNGQVLAACSSCSSGLTWVSQPATPGTVTAVGTGVGLLGGPITTTGTICLAPSGVTAGSYAYANISVDIYGRVTAASGGATPIPATAITGKGVVLTGTAANSPVALAAGSNGYVLTACSACSTGLTWATVPTSGIPTSAITGKGALVTGTAASTVSTLPVGSNGFVLTADSACANGLKWAAAGAASVPATPTTEGTVYGFTANAASFGTALGYEALNTTVTGPGNVAIGTSAGCSLTSGQLNTYVGSGAGCANTIGCNNIALGAQALFAHVSGDCNIAIGNLAGLNLTTESGNVILGPYQAEAGCDNNVYISDGTGALRLRLNENGALALGGSGYGTAGQVLTSGGPATTPTWTTVASSGGTVTSITAGTGLSGGTISTTGTIALANTTVTAGAYTYGSFTVDAQGRLTAASSGTAPVTAVTGTAPISVTSGLTPDVSIAAASTTVPGAVQLYNNTDSNSTTLALTAAQGKNLQEQITALAVSSNITLGGTYDANTGLVSSVTTQGTTAGLVVGSALPAPGVLNNEIFVIVDVQGTNGPNSPTLVHVGDWYLSDGTTWQFLNVGNQPAAATTTTAGVVCLSTNALAQAGTDATTALTPAAGASAYIPKTCVTAKGDLITGTAASTPTTLTVGTDGQVLLACSTAPNGICWGTAGGGGGGSPATPTVAGIVLGCTTATVASLGSGALANNTGAGNTAVGVTALRLNTSGFFNTAVGNNALCANTTGNFNSALGNCALFSNVGGSSNVAVGWLSICANASGNGNTGVGVSALRNNSTGVCNTAVGFQALTANTTGCYNVAIGSDAMGSKTTGNANIAIGTTNSTGTVAPVFNLTTEGNRIVMGHTAVTNAYVQVAWTVTSDARDKTNVTALPVGLDFVNQLNPVSFQFRESRECDTATGPVRYGFLAQEVLEAEGENPVIVDTEVPENLKITNDHFNAVLVKAIQELSAQNKALEARIAQLEANG